MLEEKLKEDLKVKIEEDRNSIVHVNQLTKKFGDFVAVNSLDLNISKNTCVGLLGPNGAGKSTLIKMLYGAAPRTSGNLKVFGLDPQSSYRIINRRLGVVTQQNSLDLSMTVEENMRMFARFIGLSAAEEVSRIEALLEFMQLSHKKKSPVMALSGGMQRRLVFVRALLGNPELIILDEPTTGLDPAVRQLLWSKISELKNQGATILLTTHYMDEAEQLCDHVVVMDKGTIKNAGSPAHMVKQHCPGYVAVYRDHTGDTKANSKDVDLMDLKGCAERHGLATTALHGWVQVRGTSIEQLLHFQQDLGHQASLLRPSNLEDVFLKLTGRGLDNDA